MVKTAKAPRTMSPDAQLRSFIAKFSPADQKRIRSVRAAMRKRLPTANEFVYDNYNFFVIGYGPNERPSDAPFSIAARADAVSLCFLHGATLKDPKKILKGSGNQVRSIRLASAEALKDPDLEALIAAAIADSDVPFPTRGRGRLIIRSVSAKQQPRQRRALRK